MISYYSNTKYLVIEYAAPKLDEQIVFECASDAAFADNDDCTSSEGYVIKLYGGSIDWRAMK